MQEELKQLRRIVLDCQLTEQVKWHDPCYAFQNKNIVLVNGFNEYCALLFVKGALLKDAEGILVKPGENTQGGRLVRFTRAREIVEMEPALKAYIRKAVEVEKAGLRVKLNKSSDFKVPEEFEKKLNESPALKAAFAALTPGRQRGYLLYFSGAKQSKTRETRVEKCTRQILNGKGLDD